MSHNSQHEIQNVNISNLGIIFSVDNESTDMEFTDVEKAFDFLQGYEYYTHDKKDVNKLTLKQFTDIVKKAFIDQDEVALYSDVDLYCVYYGCFYVKEL